MIDTIDITEDLTLRDLLKELRCAHEPRALRVDGKVVAIITPVGGTNGSRQLPKKTREDYEAFRSAAGSWADVDTNRLIHDIYEDRERSIRPSIASDEMSRS